MIYIPIEIVNIILNYVSDLKHTIFITQYHPITHKKYYKINFYSDLLWNIKSTLLMKRFYPYYNNYCTMAFRELYKFGKEHYEKELREKIIR